MAIRTCDRDSFVMASWRNRQLAKPAPVGWSPKRGEEVVLPLKPGTKLVSTGVCLVTLNDIVRVKLRFGWNEWVREFMITELRPVPPDE